MRAKRNRSYIVCNQMSVRPQANNREIIEAQRGCGMNTIVVCVAKQGIKVKGLLCAIYKADLMRGVSNGGLSSKYESVVLTGPGVPQVFEPSDTAPEVVLKERGGHMYVEPAEPMPEGHVGYMSGGAFVYSTDGRFPSEYPLGLHDRSETYADYEALSR